MIDTSSGGVPPNGLIVIGGSAGSVSALTTVVASLPPDLPAAVLVVIHVGPDARSSLPQILDRAGRLPARHPEAVEALRPGTILVAPPDRHLLVNDGHVELSRGPLENRHRPSIDATFRSVARWYPGRAAGVVLSGAMRDGAAGLRTIALAGGSAIVQDPAEARFSGMPESALELTDAETLSVVQIAGRLADIARTWRTPVDNPSVDQDDVTGVTEPSGLGCPACGGVLWERKDGTGYQCRVGHGYAAEDLSSAQRESIEAALWSAIRALEENRELNQRLADRTRAERSPSVVRHFADLAHEAGAHAATLRALVLRESE